MSQVFTAMTVVGGLALLTAIIVTDMEMDGMPFLSLTNVSAAITGGGISGLLSAEFGAQTSTSVTISTVAGILTFVAAQGLHNAVKGGEPNEIRGLSASIGCLGHVSMTIPEKGWGEVTYTDYDGSLVSRRAISADGTPLGNGAHVYISDVDGETLLVIEVPPI
jgi:membrane protein implicated in regulation of membrane protease activity